MYTKIFYVKTCPNFRNNCRSTNDTPPFRIFDGALNFSFFKHVQGKDRQIRRWRKTTKKISMVLVLLLFVAITSLYGLYYTECGRSTPAHAHAFTAIIGHKARCVTELPSGRESQIHPAKAYAF